jgi:hypothetical protein
MLLPASLIHLFTPACALPPPSHFSNPVTTHTPCFLLHSFSVIVISIIVTLSFVLLSLSQRSNFSHYSRPVKQTCRSPRRRRVALSFAKHSALRSSSPNIYMRQTRCEQTEQVVQIRVLTLTCARSIATSSSAFCATSVLTPSSVQHATGRLLHCPVTSKKTNSPSDRFPRSIQVT